MTTQAMPKPEAPATHIVHGSTQDLMSPTAIVAHAEAVHAAMDMSGIMDLFEEDVIFYWNGKVAARNKAELQRWYEDFFATIRAFEITKTLRSAAGDILTVEWRSKKTYAAGNLAEQFGMEIWFLRHGRLREWRAQATEYPL